MSHFMCFLSCLLLFLPVGVPNPIHYELIFDRSGDTIILKCRERLSGLCEQVEFNDNITFWVNVTGSVRVGLADLRERTDLPGKIINEDKFIFGLRPELEGLYSCGLRQTLSEGGSAIISKPKPLICKRMNYKRFLKTSAYYIISMHSTSS